MGGTVNADTWKNSDGTENYKCRAWVNFNGTGTVAIRASGNVSSITDNGTGNYTVNITTALADTDYVWTGSSRKEGAASVVNETNPSLSPRATTSIDLYTFALSGASHDPDVVNMAVFR